MKKVVLVAAVGAGSLLGGLFRPLAAQPTQRPEFVSSAVETRTPRAGNYLQGGIEAYLRGEYEMADALFRRANSARGDLLEPDRLRLDEYLRKSEAAMTGRRQALNHLHQAEESIRAGRPLEAEPALRVLKSNKYLTAREIQQVNTLAEQTQRRPGQGWGLMRPGASQPAIAAAPPPITLDRPPAPTPPQAAVPARDPGAVLAEARQALARHEYEQAEELAARAEKAGYSTLFPWKDTPAKIRRDARQGRSQQAREMLKQAHAAIQAGELPKARQLVTDAEALKPTLMWWDEYAPDRLRAQLAQAEANPTPPPLTLGPLERPSQAVQQTAAKASPEAPMSAAKPAPAEDAAALTRQARQLFQQGQVEAAEQAARQARGLPGIKWTLVNDTPDKVLADIARARETKNRDQAAQLLAEARRLLELNQFDAAEKLTYQAEALRSGYPLWHRGERHDSLRAEIATRRKQVVLPELPPLLDPAAHGPLAGKQPPRKSDQPQKVIQVVAEELPTPAPLKLLDPKPLPQPGTRPELPPPVTHAGPGSSVARRAFPMQAPLAQAASNAGRAEQERAQSVLAQARAHVLRGEHREALSLAAQVQSMRLTFRDGEDTPEKVVQTIGAKEAQANGRRDASGIEATRRMALRQLAEARSFQQQGRLLNALEAACAAQQRQAVFGPRDEVPEVVMADLRKDCRGQIDTCSAVAETLASHGRYQDAETYLRYSQQLALSFQLPSEAIDQQLAQVRSRATAGTELASELDPEAKRLLQSIEREWQQGRIAEARRLAERLYGSPFDLKAQANEWLARIDEIEFHRHAKDADVRYELGVQAFINKDFEGAANYLKSADFRLLNPRKRAHARELLASILMQERSKAAGAKDKTRGNEGQRD